MIGEVEMERNRIDGGKTRERTRNDIEMTPRRVGGVGETMRQETNEGKVLDIRKGNVMSERGTEAKRER